MRDYKIEAPDSVSQRPDSFWDWFRGYNASDSHRAGESVVIAGMHNVGRSPIYSWIDSNSAWYSYRVASTILYCGLFGAGFGECLIKFVGGW